MLGRGGERVWGQGLSGSCQQQGEAIPKNCVSLGTCLLLHLRTATAGGQEAVWHRAQLRAARRLDSEAVAGDKKVATAGMGPQQSPAPAACRALTPLLPSPREGGRGHHPRDEAQGLQLERADEGQGAPTQFWGAGSKSPPVALCLSVARLPRETTEEG